MLKELQRQWTETMTQAEEIRKKYEGKPGDMPGDEQERWEKALADCDALQVKIETEKKHAQAKAWGEALSDVQPEIEKFAVKEISDAKKEIKAFWSDLFLKSGPEIAQRVTEGEKKALSMANPAAGGYTVVPMELAREVIRLSEDALYIRKLATKHTLTSAQSLGIVAMADLSDFTWAGENTTYTEDTSTPFERRELAPKFANTLIKVSKTLVRFSDNAEAELMRRLIYVKARSEEKKFLLGTGTGQPLGIFVASASGISTGRDVSTGTANVCGADDLINTVATLKAAYRAGARWIIHRNLEGRIRKLKDSQNNYIWQPMGTAFSNGVVSGMASTICGFPYDISEYITDPSLTGNITTGTYIAVLGDYSAYHIADSLEMEIQPLLEAYATANQIGYACRVEVDGMPVDENAFARLKVS